MENLLQLTPGHLREVSTALLAHLVATYIFTNIPRYISLSLPHSARLRNLQPEFPTLLLSTFREKYRGR